MSCPVILLAVLGPRYLWLIAALLSLFVAADALVELGLVLYLRKLLGFTDDDFDAAEVAAPRDAAVWSSLAVAAGICC